MLAAVYSVRGGTKKKKKKSWQSRIYFFFKAQSSLYGISLWNIDIGETVSMSYYVTLETLELLIFGLVLFHIHLRCQSNDLFDLFNYMPNKLSQIVVYIKIVQ